MQNKNPITLKDLKAREIVIVISLMVLIYFIVQILFGLGGAIGGAISGGIAGLIIYLLGKRRNLKN